MRTALLLAALALAACDPPPPSAATQEVTVKRIGTEIVSTRLRDPGSAQFLGVRLSDLDGFTTVCGSVNARNGFGGYTGPRRFIVAGDTAVIEDDTTPQVFEPLWRDACGVSDRLDPEAAQ